MRYSAAIFFGHSGPKLICTHGEYNVLYFLRDIGHVGGYGGPWLWRPLAMADRYPDGCHLHYIELQGIRLPSNQATKQLYHSHLWVSMMYQSRQLEAFFATLYDFN